MTRKKHGNSERADYLHMVAAILIFSAKIKDCVWGLEYCLLGVIKIFVINLGGIEIFFQWDWEGRKVFCTSHENVTPPPPPAGNK